mmetsp:Transcript_44457/g.71468  ORF Transcript_44457/g.71468 Transcript_44457/m.71468 type:complete len:135 (+) Transcript_44457:251-655(+)
MVINVNELSSCVSTDDQLAATEATLASSEDPNVATVFGETHQRLKKLLQMHRSSLETQRILDVAQAGLLLERKSFSDKIEAIRKLCQEILQNSKSLENEVKYAKMILKLISSSDSNDLHEAKTLKASSIVKSRP